MLTQTIRAEIIITCISHGAQRNLLRMGRSRSSCGNTYILLHAKFVLASGATDKRTIEHADTNNMGRDNYDMNIPWCSKKPTQNEKVRQQLREYLYLIARKVRFGVRRNSQENDRACWHTSNTGRDNYSMHNPWCSKKPKVKQQLREY